MRAAHGQSEPGVAEPLNRWTRARLWLRIQRDAFAFDPFGYLQALAWRARGLRVRSRNRIAALVGRSPSAYAYWIASREPAIRARALHKAPSAAAAILPVIDCSAGLEGLDRTLKSLPPDAQAFVVGGPSDAGAVSIETIDELEAYFDSAEAWVCPISCGDRLANDALHIYGAALAGEVKSEIVYSDDDLIDADGCRMKPHFKPQWNRELFEHHDFLTGASVVRVRRDDLRKLPERGWPEALVRTALDRGSTPVHLSQVLHHRSARPGPCVPAKPQLPAFHDAPAVSIIIPTRNRADLLRACIEGVKRTDYPAIDIIVVDNESDEPDSIAYLQGLSETGVTVMRVDGRFNYSALNNAAAAAARGELLCFLNNDIEMLEGDWLDLLVRQAIRPDIGAVGARLLYPDRTIQHAGVFIGIGGGAGHGHRFLRDDDAGYFERARLPQRVSAVTGACLVVAREKFLAVDGFDEETFPVAFNDVDLCLKLNARGWQSFYEPRATLIHHESKSRGSDRAKANRGRFGGELAALKRKWGTDQHPDPFHHPHLSPFCEQFLIAI
jgi:GT2 family glycosyltransferase